MAMTIVSPAFKAGEMIPAEFSCDGPNVSPPLVFGNVPAEAKSLAIIVDDPDAPAGTWVHWVAYNIPAGTKELARNIPPQKELPNGMRQGINDFRKIGYGGPCPPGGTHRYFFKLYALDVLPNLPAGATKAQLLDAMKGRILAQAELVGKYRR
ncbi:MAG: YbhB/YbcL family Raf kinase inhibitor-like protein [Candidatus Aminicenantes bacterium]|nr:YbhB/YbcL family Raf kinase inhibitor-like protein [Candidatus Aminicenantes bacterium]